MAHKNFQYAFNLHVTVNTNFRIMDVLPERVCVCLCVHMVNCEAVHGLCCVHFIGTV